MGVTRLRRSDADAALRRLAISDHEVIKAMEKRLIADGDLPADFGEKREGWRERVKKGRGWGPGPVGLSTEGREKGARPKKARAKKPGKRT